MAIARAALVTLLSGELEDVLTLASITAADTAGNLKEPVDQAFRYLGTAETGLATGTVATGDEKKGIAYAMYFSLDRAVRALLKKMNVAAGSAKANLKEQLDNVKAERDRWLAIAQGYGLPIGLGLTPTPFMGGISEADRDTIAADTDRTPALFDRRDLLIGGIDYESLDPRIA